MAGLLSRRSIAAFSTLALILTAQMSPLLSPLSTAVIPRAYAVDESNLSIQKTGPASVVRGATTTNITYTVAVTNAGPTAATNVAVTDLVPAGLTFVAGSSTAGCAPSGANVVCDAGTLAINETKNLTLVFSTPTPDPCSTQSITNTATVAGTQTDPDTANNQSSVTTSLTCPQASQANLSITKTAPATIIRGQDITYQFTASNAGPDSATTVVITDPIPSGLTYVTSTGNVTCTQSSGTLSCAVGTLAANANVTFSVVFTVGAVSSCTPSTLTNTATITGDQTDPVTTNNQATATTSVTCPTTTDLMIAKTGPAEITRSATSAVNITYIVTVTSNGGASTNVVVTDPIPTGLTFVAGSSDSACAVQGGNVVCSIASMTAGQSKQMNLTFSVPTSASCAQTAVTNTASITGGTPDSNTANNQSQTVTTTIKCPAATQCADGIDNDNDGAVDLNDFSCSNATDNDEMNPKSLCQDGIDNDGDGFTDFPNDPGCSSKQDNDEANAIQGNGCIEIRKETFDTQGNPLTPVAQFTFTLDSVRTATNNAAGIGRFDNVLPGTHTVTETVPASWTQQATTPANGVVTVTSGTACAIVTFRNKQFVNQTPTFQVQKSDGRTNAQAGETLTYSIVVTNTSQTEAQNVQIVDVLPQYVTFVSASDGPSRNGQTLSWTITSIPGGSSRTLTVQTRVNDNTPDGFVIRNIVQVNAGTTAEDTTVIQGAVAGQIDLDISDDPDPVEPGEELEYEITVKNLASQNRTITLLQILPDDTEFIDASNGGDEDEGSIIWTNLSIPANSERTITVVVEVSDDAEDGDLLYTIALADGASEEETTEVVDDDDEDDDDGEDEDIDVTKEASPPEVFPGGIVEYTVTVENTGDETLHNIEIIDNFSPAGISVIDDGDADKRTNDSLTWELDSLSPGKTKVFRYRIAVDAGAFAGQIIRNDVRVTSDEDADDTASTNVSVITGLPQTGFGLTGDGPSAFLQPYRGKSAGGAVPFTALLTVTISGLAAGAGLGKKFLIGL